MAESVPVASLQRAVERTVRERSAAISVSLRVGGPDGEPYALGGRSALATHAVQDGYADLSTFAAVIQLGEASWLYFDERRVYGGDSRDGPWTPLAREEAVGLPFNHPLWLLRALLCLDGNGELTAVADRGEAPDPLFDISTPLRSAATPCVDFPPTVRAATELVQARVQLDSAGRIVDAVWGVPRPARATRRLFRGTKDSYWHRTQFVEFGGAGGIVP